MLSALCLWMWPAPASAADPGSLFGEVTAGLATRPNSTSSLAGVVVTATAPSGATATATTDANGDYEIDNLPAPDTYTVSFAPPSGYGPKTLTGIEVTPDVSTEADAILVELPASVTGVVTDHDGQALAGMVIEAIPAGFPCPSGYVCGPESATGDSGGYTIGALAAGGYDLQVMDAGRAVDEGTVTVTAGGTVTINVRLGPAPVPEVARARNAERDLSWLNAERARLGLPAGIVLNQRWSLECAAHNVYQRDNNVIQHPENPQANGASVGRRLGGAEQHPRRVRVDSERQSLGERPDPSDPAVLAQSQRDRHRRQPRTPVRDNLAWHGAPGAHAGHDHHLSGQRRARRAPK